MSATTIPGSISQVVGNAFPIFGNMLPGNGGEEKGDEMDDEHKVSCFPSGSKLLCEVHRACFTYMHGLMSFHYKPG